MKIYEWVDKNGRGVVTNWPKLQESQRAKLDSKLDMLVNAHVDPKTRQASLSGLLVGPGFGGQQYIYKLRVRGNVQLRPMICLGPLGMNEWTVLYPSTEKGDELIPSDAAALAEARRLEILGSSGKSVGEILTALLFEEPAEFAAGGFEGTALCF